MPATRAFWPLMPGVSGLIKIRESQEKEKYRFNVPLIPLIIFTLLVFFPIIIISFLISGNSWLWITTTILSLLYVRFVSVVDIGPDGVRLYRINMLRWIDVAGAEAKNILWLKYIRVKRHKGINYWIPLYFKGQTDIRNALKEHAPTDNPIALCI